MNGLLFDRTVDGVRLWSTDGRGFVIERVANRHGSAYLEAAECADLAQVAALAASYTERAAAMEDLIEKAGEIPMTATEYRWFIRTVRDVFEAENRDAAA